jgi:hypothetical protein
MKTLALETFLVAQSIAFWVFALPLAVAAFPLLSLVQKAASLRGSVKMSTDRTHLTPRLA